MAERSAKIAEEEAANSVFRKESTAVALRLKPNEHCHDCYGNKKNGVHFPINHGT